MPPHVIPVPGTTNLRDIGGYPARGGRVRSGRVLRGEALVFPGADTKAAIYCEDLAPAYRTLGCRTVIDLRGALEAETQPNAWPLATGGTLVALPMDAGGEGDATLVMRALLDGSLKSFGVEELSRFYAAMVHDLAPHLGRVFSVLAEPGSLPALVHCTAGKDRTGVVMALLLESLGTPREHVLTDYEYTQILRPNRVEAYRDRLATAGVDPDAVRTLFESPAPVMQRTLEGIEADYGSIDAYLTGPAHVAPQSLERLREALIE